MPSNLPAGVGLHVDTPLLGVEVEGGQRARLAQVLNFVDVLVAAIVASTLQVSHRATGQGSSASERQAGAFAAAQCSFSICPMIVCNAAATSTSGERLGWQEEANGEAWGEPMRQNRADPSPPARRATRQPAPLPTASTTCPH